MVSSTNSLKSILLTGGSGQFGQEIIKCTPRARYKIHYPDSSEVDVTDKSSICKALNKYTPNIVIHCAAMTRPMINHKVSPHKSIDINIIGTSYLASECSKRNIKMVYISTDYVYKGDCGLYKETDEVLPVNHYAMSKLGGEMAVQMLPNYLIFRAALFPPDFNHTMAFSDVKKSYITMSEASSILWDAISKDLAGIYNLGGDPQTVFNYVKSIKPDVNAGSYKDCQEPVPTDISLSIQKLKDHLL